jgi:hypothetical protein
MYHTVDNIMVRFFPNEVRFFSPEKNQEEYKNATDPEKKSQENS